MSLETDLKTLIAVRCARVYPDVAPSPLPTLPYVTYQQIGGTPIRYTEGSVPDKRHAMVQVNVWAATRIAATALALQLDADLRAATVFQAEPITEIAADKVDDMEIYGAAQDWNIWAAR